MTKNIFAEVDNLAKKLSPEQKKKIMDSNKFMYEVVAGVVSIFPLVSKKGNLHQNDLPSGGDLEKLSNEPLISISKEEIECQNLAGLPNMYYPVIRSDLPVEIKTAYFLLKTMANQEIVDWRTPASLYDCQKNFLGHLLLRYGR